MDKRRSANKYASQHRESANQKGSDWYRHHKEEVLQKYQGLKREVLTHYGDGNCICVRCGYDDMRALSIDHINGGGTHQRTLTRRHGGNQLYSWLKRNGYPDGYQTLCLNCQFVKRVENNEHRYSERIRSQKGSNGLSTIRAKSRQMVFPTAQ